jgi:squalene-hopene/tetraprenyl-beta-curcumene cyclase
MWAVLGLVSTDVLTVAVKGVTDGAHVEPTHEITIEADDNGGAGVSKIELLVDDLEVHQSKGRKLTYTWKTSALSTGRHTLDAVATNARGQISRRRFEVYAGDVFFTQLGTRFEQDATRVTTRGIAPATARGTLRLRVYSSNSTNGTPTKDKVVYETSRPAENGALEFLWSGKDGQGKSQPGGRYFAEIAFVDAQSGVRQTEETLFMHADAEVAKRDFAEVAGRLELSRDGSGAANAEVELVDDSGRIVQSVQSNEAGQYRFKNVDKGKYKVRFKKSGFAPKEAEVKAEAGAVAPASAAF